MSENENTTGPFLICDLRPEWNRRPYVSFWRPKNANYAYPLVWAGDYTEAEVMAGGSYYTTFEDGKLIRFPILRSLVEPLAVPPAPGRIDGDTGPVIVNTIGMQEKLRSVAYERAVLAVSTKHATGDDRIIAELIADDPDLTHDEAEALIREAGHG